MKTIHLAIGIHNHQPNGNFESVFENAFAYAYEPFVQMLEKSLGPNVPIGNAIPEALLR